MTDTRTDAELMTAHREGDPRAFTELVGRHAQRMWGVAVRTLRDTSDAEDAVQEALVAAYRSAGAFRGDASVRTWLHRILVNTCIDRMRRERGRWAAPWPEHEPASRRPDPASEVVTRLTLEEALGTLPDHQRIAVLLVDVEGFGVDEVAQILDVAPGTVKSRCARARRRLAEHLREHR